MKRYTYKQLIKMRITKEQLFKNMPDSFDFALQQNWLNNISNGNDKLYRLILSTTVWSYPAGCIFGKPFSACIEIQNFIERRTK